MDVLCTAMLAKIDEQIVRTEHMIVSLPEDCVNWQPPIPGAWTPAALLGHLLECLAGFCAVLYKVEPDRLSHFLELRSLPVNHGCGKDEALMRLSAYRERIHEGFALLEDERLGNAVPTIFTGAGESLLTLLLGNLEHLINHKHQLFTYLKMLGVEVTSRDLYCFRGE